MNDPIGVWPPGTLFLPCSMLGIYYDCTNNYPDYLAEGYTVCCLS